MLHGDEDILVPHRNGEIIARRIPAARLKSLRGVAHAIPPLDRECILDAIEDVRSVDRAEPEDPASNSAA